MPPQDLDADASITDPDAFGPLPGPAPGTVAPLPNLTENLPSFSVSFPTRLTFSSWVRGLSSERRRCARLSCLRSVRKAGSFLESLPAAFAFATWSLRSAILTVSV